MQIAILPTSKRVLFPIVCVFISIALTHSAAAHDGPHLENPSDIHQLEGFMDGVIKTVMYQRQIPGCVLTIVKDGEVIINKGYGYANAEQKTPVDPVNTLFRIASITKMINATAVMQLVEQGKLDLNGEVNALLKQYDAPLTIAEHYPQKIRLLDLINHTAGFDERAIGMARLDPAHVPSLGAYLAARMPPQVMVPGSTMSYSNHGVALAGYLVELASGTPYNSYVRDNIYVPLGMTHSSMEWNAEIAPNLAQGYKVSRGAAKPVPFDHLCIPPAGAMLSSGADMARFMIAHLQRGQYGDARILQESTAVEMHRQQYQHDPRLDSGIAVGFYTGTRHGHRYLEHGGNLNGFSSRIYMLPDDGIGIFMSCNVDDNALRGAIVGQFMDQYFADHADDAGGLADHITDADLYVGKYRSNRFARRSIEKLITLMEQYEITADTKGNLYLTAPGQAPKAFGARDNGVFINVREGDMAIFRSGNDHNVTHILTGEAALERLQWYEESQWHFAFIAVALLLFVTAVVCWPVAYIARRRNVKAARKVPAYFRITAWFFAALGLFVLVMLGVTLAGLDKYEFTYGMPLRMSLLLLIPPILAVGAALLVVNTLAVWWQGYWSGWSRLHYTLVTAACVGLIPFFLFWNLMGFNW